MRKFRLYGNLSNPRYNQKAVDSWAKRIPHDDPLESTYSALLVIVLVSAVFLMGLIIALAVFSE